MPYPDSERKKYADWSLTDTSVHGTNVSMNITTRPKWTLGDRIRKARNEADLSKQVLADHLGVSMRTVTRWESDHVSPQHDSVVAVAAATGVNLGWLVGEEAAA